MSQFIKFYLTSSILNMFRSLIHPSSGACDFSIVQYHHIGCVFFFRCVLEFRCGWVGVVSVWQAEASACLQAPDDGCINVRNVLRIEEVK